LLLEILTGITDAGIPLNRDGIDDLIAVIVSGRHGYHRTTRDVTASGRRLPTINKLSELQYSARRLAVTA
jgi:hypothetical protein